MSENCYLCEANFIRREKIVGLCDDKICVRVFRILSENNVYFYRVLHVFYTFIALLDRYKSYGMSANETSRNQSEKNNSSAIC